MFAAPRMAAAGPDASLPTGTVSVLVTNALGQPAAGAELVLGIMSSDGGRDARDESKARTDAEGRYSFRGLPTGSAQAYRVNLVYDGAKVSSTPFRLPERGGYRVGLQKLPTTRDSALVFQMIGQSMVELRDDRLHVTQQARLTNAGGEVFVFPKGGQRVRLPDGFISFQFQPLMTDQRLEERPGEGFAIVGSLPPGTVTLSWTYDLELSGSEMRIPVEVPFRTYMYRVISDAPEGLGLDVQGMPEPELLKDQGRSLWVTQVQQRPEDPPLRSLSIRLRGIPGPGPGRWIAVALASLALVFGLFALLKPGQGDAERRAFIARRREQLLEQVRDLDAQHARGEIGPEYHGERTDALVDALALVLRDEQLLDQRSGQRA